MTLSDLAIKSSAGVACRRKRRAFGVHSRSLKNPGKHRFDMLEMVVEIELFIELRGA